MIYLFPSGNSYSIVYEGNVLTEEQKANSIKVEKLPDGEGALKRDENGTFYFEPFEIDLEESIEATETIEQKIDRLERQIQQDNIIQFEVLATIYEELLMKG